ncbi:MAG: trigger factor [Candidatus Magasanikbacteria bacterium RIFOXYC2_FULL_42_28]|uniref:Trigger factor n=1 Tax=Candidatus Magasanikbacteria bacterium RIFOXYC2_FULL_42_28 TaxID=1798704 RepID=A0A1F6NVQ4_9BACT|nr:MAG: trigger factor [Candidatus Magasanikbacteria bacterium RIFOXYC2_FULL_42_28]
MSHTLKLLPQSQAELIITVAVADYKKDMEDAATRISLRAAIHGFRPGKAPYDIVKQQIGEIKILEEAMQIIVEKNFHTAVVAEKLTTVGMPEISLEKMAPGNDFVFKAIVALFPSLKLPDLATIKIAKKEVKVGDKQLNDVLDNLKKMRGKEVLKDGVATTADKAVVSMNMFIDKVPVEGGQAPNHQVYLSEPHYIPGFAEQIVGLKKDDKKNFTLKFPADHYQKHLAGKDIDFEVLVKDIYTLEYPTLDDEFAKGLGQTDLETLKKLLHGNLTAEAEKKETQRLEEEILHKIIEVAEFGELPEVLMRTEKHKMFNELKADLERAGIDMEKYLKDLKKTEDEIFKDFEERAITRVKAALVSRQVALDNNIKVEPSEIEKEKEAIRTAYKGDDKVEDALKRPEVLDMLAVTVQNRKVVEYLKEKVVGK